MKLRIATVLTRDLRMTAHHRLRKRLSVGVDGAAKAVIVCVLLSCVACEESAEERATKQAAEKEQALRVAESARWADSNHAHAQREAVQLGARIGRERAVEGKRGCREDGRARLATMQISADVAVTEEDGWVVVHIGGDVPSARLSRWVQLYADGDACASGRSRMLEFRGPGDELVARADPTFGIRMKH